MQKLIVENGKQAYVTLTPQEEAAHLADIATRQPTPQELARLAALAEAPLTARQWFNENPNAKLIFSMTVAEIVGEIASLVDSLVPGATTGNRTRLKLLLTALTLVVRIWVKRERLDEA